MSAALDSQPAARPPRQVPPVAELATLSLALVVVGGVYMAAHVPRRPPLGLPIALLAASGIVLASAVVMLSRLTNFAWDRFFLVVRWALLAYLISAGMIEWAFVKDHTRGGPLAVVTLMLVIFAVSVPLIIGFTVARYASPAWTSSPPAA